MRIQIGSWERGKVDVLTMVTDMLSKIDVPLPSVVQINYVYHAPHEDVDDRPDGCPDDFSALKIWYNDEEVGERQA